MNGSSKPCLYETRIDIPLELRVPLIDLLNQTLATTVDLKTQVKQAHWNVKGINFYELYQLFDEIATELEEYIDLVAERVTALGGTAMGTARTAAIKSILPEYRFNIIEGKDHLTALAEQLAIYANFLWENIEISALIGDSVTADLYTEVSKAIDRRLWLLEAHLVTSALNVKNQVAFSGVPSSEC
ncbi:MAG: DNA starvation/stationary phase protection protein Dps [Heteroscytonema crispum UTEX LB 1556]